MSDFRHLDIHQHPKRQTATTPLDALFSGMRDSFSGMSAATIHARNVDLADVLRAAETHMVSANDLCGLADDDEDRFIYARREARDR